LTTHANNAADWTGALIGLLERQQSLVTELAGLAERQSGLIEERRTDALLGLLSRRQRLIDDFSSSQEELTVLTGDLDARIASVEPDARARIQTLIADIGDQLASVMRCDGRDQELLQVARGRTAAELADLDSARSARNAYRDVGVRDSRFADRTG